MLFKVDGYIRVMSHPSYSITVAFWWRGPTYQPDIRNANSMVSLKTRKKQGIKLSNGIFSCQSRCPAPRQGSF
jgi:hypothetical protein